MVMPNTITVRNCNKTSVTPDTANSMRNRDFLFTFLSEVTRMDAFLKVQLGNIIQKCFRLHLNLTASLWGVCLVDVAVQAGCTKGDGWAPHSQPASAHRKGFSQDAVSGESWQELPGLLGTLEAKSQMGPEPRGLKYM